MHILCHVIGHIRPASAVWNNGYFFSHCDRCEREIIRESGEARWKPVPKGYQVCWRPMSEFDIRW